MARLKTELSFTRWPCTMPPVATGRQCATPRPAPTTFGTVKNCGVTRLTGLVSALHGSPWNDAIEPAFETFMSIGPGDIGVSPTGGRIKPPPEQPAWVMPPDQTCKSSSVQNSGETTVLKWTFFTWHALRAQRLQSWLPAPEP